MTRVVDILLELKQLGIAVAVEGDRLVLEAPPGVLTAEHRAELTANKADIIRLLGAKGNGSLAEIERGGSVGVTSRAQRSIWLLEQLNPGTAAWNIGTVFVVDGALDVAALERSFATILARHATLRSRFIEVDGIPTVQTPPHADWKIDYADVRAEPEPMTVAEAAAVREAQRPFDLSRGPLLRVVLRRTGESQHLVAMVFHHIAADGWSLGLIAQELGELYGEYAAGRETPLAPLSHEYSDFVTFETAHEAVAEPDVAWWRERLSGELPTVRLSRDAPTGNGRGRRVSFELPAELRTAIEAAAREREATPFMLLLTGFTLLVHRLSGERDVLISTPTSNRDRREFANLVGMFVNPVVLRTTVDDTMTAAELLERVRTASLESFAHPVSFDRVVEAVHPERHGTQTPIVQLSFAYQNLAARQLQLGDTTITPRPIELIGSRFEVSLEIWPTASRGLACNFEYASDLFDERAIARLMDEYRLVLETIVADPQVLVGRVPLIGEAERRRLLFELNDTAAAYRSDATIHDLFAEQAARTPDAPALLDPQRQLTYREVDERANRLANHLRGLGVGPEVLVGMCVDRSVEIVIAMLGILKAGGAYVPIDPAYPDDRVRFMLEDTKAPVLVKQTRRRDSLPYDGTIVDLDADATAIAHQPATARPSGATGDNLAYIIYTSGSTGRPKGTMMRHSAVSLIDWAQHTYAPAELARSIAASSVCFDFSVFEIFVPLCTGGAVIVAEDALHLPDVSFAPTMISTVPSALAELARGGRIPATVRTINSGGELLTNALAQELYRTTHAERVVNVYGPTEYTTITTTTVVERGATREPAVGRPLRNTQLYVLDANRELLPFGAVGELYIAGDGLARGYWNQPELTAERFVPNPFGPPGSRMYKSGDHVRWRADGQLEFVGRIDHQVKLRGFRIELGEIENALLRVPGVREAVVVVRRDQAEDARLIAYVGADPGTVDDAALRASAKAWLPAYMVPQEFVLLAALPRNPSGKVDRPALPRPEKAAAVFDAIHNPLVLAVVGTFCDVLGLEQMSPDDNFFDAGGHSLLAVQAANRLARVLGQPVSALSVFQAPTPKELAALLDHDLRATERHISVLQPLGDEPPLFCFHDVFSRPVHYLSLVRHLEPRQPVYGVATGPLEEQIIAHPSFDTLVRAYAAEVKRLQPNGPYRLSGYSLGGMLAFEVARNLMDRGDEAMVVLFDTYMSDRVALTPRAIGNFARALATFRPSRILLAMRQINWCRRMWMSEFALRSARKLPNWVPNSSRELALALLKANARHHFRPFSGKTVLFQGAVRGDEERFVNTDGENGWSRLVKGPLERIEVEGDHSQIMREPLVAEVAVHLQRILRAQLQPS